MDSEPNPTASESSQPAPLEAPPTPRAAKYLEPDTLSQIGGLDVVARQVVEGLRIGLHKSPVRGISSEFSAYRQYAQGDETRHIDWKAYARCDRYYIKLFDADAPSLTVRIRQADDKIALLPKHIHAGRKVVDDDF